MDRGNNHPSNCSNVQITSYAIFRVQNFNIEIRTFDRNVIFFSKY